MLRIATDIVDWDLMGPPRAFYRPTIHLFRTSPALRCAQNQHWPERTLRILLFAGALLNTSNLVENAVQRHRHKLMHLSRLAAGNHYWTISVSAKQVEKFLFADSREHCRVSDLESVEVQNGKHSSVFCWIEKLVGVPTRRTGSGFGFAVADDAGNDQIGIVEGSAIGVQQRISELSAFMDGAGSFRRNVAGNAVRPRKLLEQTLHPILVLLDVGIDLGVRAFEICVCDKAGSAVSGPNDVNHVEIVLHDQPVEMGVDEIQPSGRAPVAQQTRLD